MKKIILLFFVLLFVSNLFAKLNNDLKVHPELNGWNTTTMTWDNGLVGEYWYITIQATGDDALSEYVFMNWDWSNKWTNGSGNANTKVDFTWVTSGGSNNEISDGVTNN